MKHIVVDLEMNKVTDAEARRISCYEIIEIGAVMLDDNLSEISSFRTYVKPQYSERIAPKISKLTGITDEMVENAPVFDTAFKMFTTWCTGTGDEFVIHAWSTTDYGQISKEMVLKQYIPGESEKCVTDVEWDDFQEKFDRHLGFDRQLSLSTALDMAGLDFSGRAHDALDDARNTAELLNVFSDTELFNKTLKKIEEVMKPTSIDYSIGSIFDFSSICFE